MDGAMHAMTARTAMATDLAIRATLSIPVRRTTVLPFMTLIKRRYRRETSTAKAVSMSWTCWRWSPYLGTQLLDGGPLDRADCNGDGSVNILDALGIINVILGIASVPRRSNR